MFAIEKKLRCALAGALIAAAMALAPVGPAAAADVLSHRAIYNLSLAGSASGSKIERIEGLMFVEWSDTCGGYATTQRIVLRLLNTTGGGVSSDFKMTTWESADGLELRFHSSDQINGRLGDEFEGHAALKSRGGSGNVTLSAKDGRSLALNGGTIFPTEHTLELIRRAEKGERIFAQDVFDGSSGLDSLYEASAVIGAPFDTNEFDSDSLGAALLRGITSWPVTIAFFPYDQESGALETTPDYEIEFRLFANGVVTDMVLDYQDFKVRGALGQIEELLNSGC